MRYSIYRNEFLYFMTNNKTNTRTSMNFHIKDVVTYTPTIKFFTKDICYYSKMVDFEDISDLLNKIPEHFI